MSHRDRVLQLLRAVGALTVLLLFVVGAPLVLVRAVGWPLPTRLPTSDQLRDALGGSTVEEGTIIKALALVCWAAWLPIATSAVVEAFAWAKGTASARVPLGGLVQPAVRQLVISAALIFGGLRSAVPAPVVAATPAVATFMSTTLDPVLTLAGDEVASSLAAVPPIGTITVRDRDSLWRLAERHLGDGMRWRELWDLNQGRTFPDGRAFRDPNVIQPGWSLHCPSDAINPDQVSAPFPNPDPPAPTAPTEPAVQRPTEHFAPATPTTAVPSTSAVTSQPAERLSPARPESEVEQSGDLQVPVRLLAGSLVAAGFIALLDRLRRIQLRRRKPGHVPQPPDEKLADTETRLRLAAVNAHAERVDLALRALAGCLAQPGDRSVPGVELVSVGPDAVEILLTSKSDVSPELFEVSADGRAWTLPSSTPIDDIQRLGAGQAAPSPALVTVGAVDDRQILVDLEVTPRVLVTGDQQAVRQVVWSAAIEMSTSPWVDDIEIVIVTDRATPLRNLDRITVVPRIDDALARIQSSVADTTRDLEQAAAESTIACRVRNPADPWTPLVVLIPDVVDDRDVQRLLDAVQPGGGTCLLAGARDPSDADRVLRVDPDGAELLPVGIRLRLACLPESMAADVEALLASALDDDLQTELMAEADVAVPSATYMPRSALAPEAGGVLVSVMGSVEVRGAERTIDRRRSLELVAYLALHPDGVDEGRLRAILWPDSDPSRENFNQTVSRARQPLGHAPDGTLHFPRLVDDQSARYRLGPSVASDASLLEHACRAARREQTDEAAEHLASMLALIRGLPFEGTKGGWEWTFTEGHAARLAALAAEAAHLVAQWSIDHNDVQKALWAAAQGLRAAPGDEVLYRDCMQAHDRAGNLAGVESVMKELRGVVEDGEPYDSIHPDTVAYYEELTRRVSRAG